MKKATSFLLTSLLGVSLSLHAIPMDGEIGERLNQPRPFLDRRENPADSGTPSSQAARGVLGVGIAESPAAADEKGDESALTLDHFRTALAQNPTVPRFVIDEDEERGISIQSRAAGTSKLSLKKNQLENETITEALREALVARHSGSTEIVNSFFNTENSANVPLSAEHLTRILKNSDAILNDVQKASSKTTTQPAAASENEATSPSEDSNFGNELGAEIRKNIHILEKIKLAEDLSGKSEKATADFKKPQKEKKAEQRKKREEKIAASSLESDTDGYSTGTGLEYAVLRNAKKKLTSSLLQNSAHLPASRNFLTSSLLQETASATSPVSSEDKKVTAARKEIAAAEASLEEAETTHKAAKRTRTKIGKIDIEKEKEAYVGAQEAWEEVVLAYESAIIKAKKAVLNVSEINDLTNTFKEAVANAASWCAHGLHVEARKLEQQTPAVGTVETAQATTIESAWRKASEAFQEAVKKTQAADMEEEELTASLHHAETQKTFWTKHLSNLEAANTRAKEEEQATGSQLNGTKLSNLDDGNRVDCSEKTSKNSLNLVLLGSQLPIKPAGEETKQEKDTEPSDVVDENSEHPDKAAVLAKLAERELVLPQMISYDTPARIIGNIILHNIEEEIKRSENEQLLSLKNEIEKTKLRNKSTTLVKKQESIDVRTAENNYETEFLNHFIHRLQSIKDGVDGAYLVAAMAGSAWELKSLHYSSNSNYSSRLVSDPNNYGYTRVGKAFSEIYPLLTDEEDARKQELEKIKNDIFNAVDTAWKTHDSTALEKEREATLNYQESISQKAREAAVTPNSRAVELAWIEKTNVEIKNISSVLKEVKCTQDKLLRAVVKNILPWAASSVSSILSVPQKRTKLVSAVELAINIPNLNNELRILVTSFDPTCPSDKESWREPNNEEVSSSNEVQKNQAIADYQDAVRKLNRAVTTAKAYVDAWRAAWPEDKDLEMQATERKRAQDAFEEKYTIVMHDDDAAKRSFESALSWRGTNDEGITIAIERHRIARIEFAKLERMKKSHSPVTQEEIALQRGIVNIKQQEVNRAKRSYDSISHEIAQSRARIEEAQTSLNKERYNAEHPGSGNRRNTPDALERVKKAEQYLTTQISNLKEGLTNLVRRNYIQDDRVIEQINNFSWPDYKLDRLVYQNLMNAKHNLALAQAEEEAYRYLCGK